MALEVLIVGGGEVGRDLAGLLADEGHEVTVVEVDEERARELAAQLGEAASVVAGSGSDPLVLERAGARRVRVMAAVTGSDEVNLVASSLARFELGVPRVLARVNRPRSAWLFTPLMGVDEAINQSDLVARLIMEEMPLAGFLTLLKLQKGPFSLVEERVHPDAVAAGRAVRDVTLPAACVLAGLIREGELIPPRGDTVLQAGDEVLAVVHEEARAAFCAVLGPPSAEAVAEGGSGAVG